MTFEKITCELRMRHSSSLRQSVQALLDARLTTIDCLSCILGMRVEVLRCWLEERPSHPSVPDQMHKLFTRYTFAIRVANVEQMKERITAITQSFEVDASE